MKIRKVREEDLAEIRELERQLAEIEKEMNSSLKDNAPEEYFSFFKKEFEKDSFIGFVALEGDEIIGLARGSIKERPSFFIEDKEGKIESLIVKEKYRGKGVGKKLLNQIIDCLKERGAEVITLEVYLDNSAREFYRKMGFKEQELKMKFVPSS